MLKSMRIAVSAFALLTAAASARAIDTDIRHYVCAKLDDFTPPCTS